MNENFQASAEALNLTKGELCQLARNAVVASLLSEQEKEELYYKIEQYCRENA